MSTLRSSSRNKSCFRTPRRAAAFSAASSARSRARGDPPSHHPTTPSASQAPARATDDSYRAKPTAHDDPPPPLTSSSRHSHSSSDSASEPGTIRGDFCIELGRNVIHGSDAVASAQHEIGLWFPEGVTNYEHTAKAWIYE